MKGLYVPLIAIFSLIVVFAKTTVSQNGDASNLPIESGFASQEKMQTYPTPHNSVSYVSFAQNNSESYTRPASIRLPSGTVSNQTKPNQTNTPEKLDQPNADSSDVESANTPQERIKVTPASRNTVIDARNSQVQSGNSSRPSSTRVSPRPVSRQSNPSSVQKSKDSEVPLPVAKDITDESQNIDQENLQAFQPSQNPLGDVYYSDNQSRPLAIKVSSEPVSNQSGTDQIQIIENPDTLSPGSANFINMLIIIALLLLIVIILAFFLFKSIQARKDSIRNEKLFRALFQSSPSAILIFQNFKLRFVNSALEQLTGYTRAELLKMEIWQLIHPESLKELSKDNTFLDSNEFSFRAEFKIITKSGIIKWIDFSTRSINLDNYPAVLASAFDITEKKNYEQQLIEAEERYALIVLASNDGISDYNIPHDILYLSPQWKEMLGYKESELENTVIQWISLVDSEDRIEVNNLFEKLQKGHFASHSTEYRMNCRDGSCKWVWASFSVVFDANNKPIRILGTHSDITERKKTEEKLKESEFRYKSLFAKNSAVMIITQPESGRILDANQSAIDYYGYDRASLLSMNLSDINILSKEMMQKENIQAEKEKRTFNYSQHRLVDGTIRDVEVYSSRIELSAGALVYFIIFDITERRKIEKELQKAKETAEEAFRAKSYFISNVSHEIRTPLNAIIGLTELLTEDENLSPQQQENLKSIKYSSDHLLGIINDVLDFSKIEAGRVNIEKTDFDIHKLIRESAKTIDYKAREKGIEIKITVDPTIPQVLLGDPSRLRQVLLNLLGNAIKFTHEGHIDIDLKKLDENDSQVELRFSVSDTGIGIQEDKLEKIFESFSQAETDTSRRFGGTGLGLSICKKLVELQGGKIGVKSIEGMGSTFWFDLNYEVSLKPLIPEKTRTQAQLKNLRGIKILLVEDDRMNQFVMTQIMKKWLAQIDIVDNGLLAIQKLEQQRYNLVLMDLHMPELNGYETTKIIRNPQSKVLDHDVPIIALTADVNFETRERVKNAGMNDFLTKPSEQNEMFEKIKLAVINLPSRLEEKIEEISEPLPAEPTVLDERTSNRVKKALADIFDDDIEGTVGLINRFLKDIPKTIIGINEAFYDDDMITLNTLIHRIKPGYSYMGFREVSEKIERIQVILGKEPLNKKELEILCSQLDDDSRAIVKVLREIRNDFMKSSSVGHSPNR